MSKSKLLTCNDAAKLLGFTPDYIRRLILDGSIQAEKMGTTWVMSEKAIAHIKRKRRYKPKENQPNETNE
jgi:excisionase family DNA binding protein